MSSTLKEKLGLSGAAPAPEPTPGDPPAPSEDSEKAVATAHAEGRAEGHAAGLTEGRAEERQRIAAILGDDEAQGRRTLAEHLAFNSEMKPEDAVAMLAASSKESGGGLASKMAKEPAPNLGPASAPAEPKDHDAMVAEEVASLRRFAPAQASANK